MSPAVGMAIFYGVLGTGGLLTLVALVWCLGLGLIGNRRSSGKRDVCECTYDIRGTVDDTLTQIEKGMRDLYKEPMEIERDGSSVTFRRLTRQPFLRVLQHPLERVSFRVEPQSGDMVRITYAATLRWLRQNTVIIVIPFILLISAPGILLIAQYVWEHAMPAFAVAGDLTPELKAQRRIVLHILQIVHIVWPALALLALFPRARRELKREYELMLDRIQYID